MVDQDLQRQNGLKNNFEELGSLSEEMRNILEEDTHMKILHFRKI